jgi:hypothetical protein
MMTREFAARYGVPGTFARILLCLCIGAHGIQVHADARSFWTGTVSASSGVPAFTVQNPGGRTRMTLFLSPSCNYCNSLYVELFGAVGSGDYDIEDKELTFILFPRKEYDYEIASALLCLGPDRFPHAFHRYQHELYDEFHGKRVGLSFAKALAKRIANDAASSTSEWTTCIDAPSTSDALHRSHALGLKLSEEKGSMPLVLIDGKPTDIDSYRDLERHD